MSCQQYDVVVLFIILVTTTYATYTQHAVFTDAQTGDRLGYTIDIEDSTLVATAANETIGSAYIYTLEDDSGSNWELKQILTPNDEEIGANFGNWVDLKGSSLGVGAFSDDESGSVYIYTNDGDTWSLHQKISGENAQDDDGFGRRFIFEADDIIIVALDKSDDDAYNSGKLQKFYYGSSGAWIYAGDLKASDPSESSRFGSAIAVQESLLVVGAMGTNAVYVFSKDDSSSQYQIDWTQYQKLSPSDGDDNDWFGWDVHIISSEYLAVTSVFDDRDGYTDAGSVYIFQLSDGTWTETQKIAPDSSKDEMYFGLTLQSSENGSKIFIGGRCVNDESGCIMIYEKQAGLYYYQETITADVSSSDAFSRSVRVSDDSEYVYVGAYDTDSSGTDAGAWYIFEDMSIDLSSSLTTVFAESDWSQTSKFVAPDAQEGGQFGRFLWTYTTTIAICADEDEDKGAVYIYYLDNYGNWNFRQKLRAEDGSTDDHFGESVFVDEDTIVVGAFYSDDQGTGSGSAYVYERNENDEWIFTQKLLPDDGESHDNFGRRLALSGDDLLITLDRDDDAGSKSGSVQYFSREDGEWSFVYEITASDASSGARFGSSLYLKDELLAIGSMEDGCGAVYLFEKTGFTWSEQHKLEPESCEDDSLDWFGWNAYIVNDSFIIIGSLFYDYGLYENIGAVYVFVKDNDETWNQVQIILPENADESDIHFSTSLYYFDGVLVVGSTGKNSDTGSIDIYLLSDEDEVYFLYHQTIAPSDGEPGDLFGRSIVSSDSDIFVGSFSDNNSTGAVYVFSFNSTEVAVSSENTTDSKIVSPTESSDSSVIIQQWVQSQKINAEDGTDDTLFGTFIAAGEDNYLFVSSDQELGNVYVHQKIENEWEYLQNISESDSAGFGTSISVNGDICAIGAPESDAGRGRVYVYRENSTRWESLQMITPDDGDYISNFGRTIIVAKECLFVSLEKFDESSSNSYGIVQLFVDIDGSWIFSQDLEIGDLSYNNSFGTTISLYEDSLVAISATINDVESVFIFENNGSFWIESFQLTSPNSEGESFGFSIQWITENLLVIGSPVASESDISNLGIVYVYNKEYDDWTLTETIVPETKNEDIYFGKTIAYSGNGTLAIGAPGLDNGMGAIYLYLLSGESFMLYDTLYANDRAASDFFGQQTIFAYEYDVIVASPFDDDQGSESGSIYVFSTFSTDDAVGSGEWVQALKILADDGVEDSNFGSSVATSNMLTVIGARYDQENGSVYVYEKDGNYWTFQEKILSDDETDGERFGESVDIFNDTIVVGAIGGGDAKCGAVYIYSWNSVSWEFQQKLVPDDGENGDSFGLELAVYDKDLLVAATKDDTDATRTGSVRYYQTIDGSWNFLQKLEASDASANDQFGSSISLHNTTAAIGAVFDDSGSVYMFEKDDNLWEQKQKLEPQNGDAALGFGSAVHLCDESLLLVGAENSEVGDYENAGRVYVYEKIEESWTLNQQLFANTIESDMFFGASIAASTDCTMIAIGANGANNGGGQVYVFVSGSDQYLYHQTLQGHDTVFGDDFGRKITATDDAEIIVGAIGDSDLGTESGSVYFFPYNFTGDSVAPTLPPSDGTEDTSSMLEEYGDLVIIVLISVFALLSLLGYGASMRCKLSVAIMMVSIFDIVTDFFLADWARREFGFGIECLVVILFTAVPLMANIFAFCKIIGMEMEHNPDYVVWHKKNVNVLAAVSIVTATNLSNALILDTRLLGKDMFDAPLSENSLRYFRMGSILSIGLEDVPQLAIQIWLIKKADDSFNWFTVAAMISSGVALAFGILRALIISLESRAPTKVIEDKQLQAKKNVFKREASICVSFEA